MPKLTRALVSVLLVAVAMHVTGAQASSAPFDEADFLRAASRADLSGLPALIEQVGSGHDPLLRELRAGFETRFLHRSEPLSPATGHAFVDALVAAFRAYWTDALLAPGHSAAALERLRVEVGALVTDREAPGGTGPFDAAVRIARAAGYGISLSTTEPLHDLVMWRDEERAHYRVDLTDGAETVEVVFLDGLVSEGWRHFASLGLTSTTGWTGGDALYCVAWAYDTGSERFRVTYLKHEARHFADFRRYPGLDEATMEYRAKLTELAYAGSSAPELLRRFARGRDAAGRDSHALANERVAREMYREIFDRPMPEHLDAWSVLGPSRINPAARRLLERSDRELQ